jgi:hypothetical protein
MSHVSAQDKAVDGTAVYVNCRASAVCTFAFFYFILGTSTETCFALTTRPSDIPDKIETHACVFLSLAAAKQMSGSYSDSSML